MRLSQYFLPLLKEEPKEAQIVSHKLMLRAGLVRQEAAGLALYRGRNGDTAERWIALMTDVDLAALPPTIDYQAYSAIVNSARGALGWTQAMTSWRQRVLTVPQPGRRLKRPWFALPDAWARAWLLRDSPAAFRERNLFTEESPLRRA